MPNVTFPHSLESAAPIAFPISEVSISDVGTEDLVDAINNHASGLSTLIEAVNRLQKENAELRRICRAHAEVIPSLSK